MNRNKKLEQAQKAASLCEQLGDTFLRLIPDRPILDVSAWYIDMARRLEKAQNAREIDQEFSSVYQSLKQGRGGPMEGYAMNEDGSIDRELSKYYRDLINELQSLTRNAWLKGVVFGRR